MKKKTEPSQAGLEEMPESAYDVVAAHEHSSDHRAEIECSEHCGCFYCLRTFPPSDITEWIDRDQTAMCPQCGIDSVLGDASGYPIEQSFLTRMRKHWFETFYRVEGGELVPVDPDAEPDH